MDWNSAAHTPLSWDVTAHAALSFDSPVHTDTAYDLEVEGFFPGDTYLGEDSYLSA